MDGQRIWQKYFLFVPAITLTRDDGMARTSADDDDDDELLNACGGHVDQL
jgi:hypothetical protein